MRCASAVSLLALVSAQAYASNQAAFSLPKNEIFQRDGQDCSVSCLGPGKESRKVGQDGDVWPFQIFQTVPYNPPELEIRKTKDKLAAGYIFIAPSNFNSSLPDAVEQPGPYIMTDTGDLVWSGPISNATNLRVQELNGKPVITYWSGFSTAGANVGHGYGSVKVLDQTYKKIHTVCPQLGLKTSPPGKYKCENDLHESYITARGTMLITAYNVTQADLTSVGGPKNGWIYDGQFYEVDITTNKVLFRWSSIEHIPVSASHQPLNGLGVNATQPFDYYHINSVQDVGDNYLANGRHTWSTQMIGPTGDVIWNIEGHDGGDFGPIAPGGRFEWQHEARVQSQSNTSIAISWFNNRNSAASIAEGLPQRPSSAIELLLRLPPSKDRSPIVLRNLVSTYVAESQGSYNRARGHQIVGFGQIPVMREYSPTARVTRGQAQKLPVGGALWEARYGEDSLVQSYRAFKAVWSATPSTKPTVVVGGKLGKCRRGFVSWNGATEVVTWEVYAGASKGNLCKVGGVLKKGFETRFGVGAAQKCVQVAAVDEAGTELRRSNVVCA